MPSLILVPTFPLGLLPVQADVTRSLTDEQEWDLPEHPVEGGEAVTDEVLTRPRSVAYEIVFTDAPPSIIPEGLGRAARLEAGVRELADRKAIITAVQPDGVITRLVFTRVGVTRDKATGRRRPVSASLRRIRIVQLELLAAIVDADLAAFGQLGSVDQGLQP